MNQQATGDLVSIITVCLNSGSTLARCINSVINQTYTNIEYIIIDGGSTDGTIEIIKSNTDRINYWISEQDHGISDAFNKGIAIAHGDYYIMLNSDDWLYPEAIELLLKSTASAMVTCGAIDIFEADSRHLRRCLPIPALLRSKSSIVHGACLIRRSVHESVGNYRVDRKIAMDHALFLEIQSRFGLSAFKTIDHTVVNFSMGGASDKNAVLGFYEVSLNLKEHGTPTIVAFYRFLVLACKHYVARALRYRRGQVIGKLL